MRCAVVLVLVAVGWSGCGDPSESALPSGQAALDEERPVLAIEARPGLRLDRLLASDGDDQAILDRMREPRTRLSTPTPNAHVDGQVDTVTTYRYDGLEIEAYEVTGGPTFIQRIVITSGSYGTSDGLSVGEPRATLEEVLGPPVATTARAVTYEVGEEPTPTRIVVTYEPNEDGVEQAVSIEWYPYVD